MGYDFGSARTGTRLAYPALVPLDRRRRLAFSDLRRLFIEFTAMNLGQGPGLLARPLETAQGDVKWFILTDFHIGHMSHFPGTFRGGSLQKRREF